MLDSATLKELISDCYHQKKAWHADNPLWEYLKTAYNNALGPQLPDALKSIARRLDCVAILDDRTVEHRYSGVLMSVKHSGDPDVFDDKYRNKQGAYRNALEIRFRTVEQCEAAILRLVEKDFAPLRLLRDNGIVDVESAWSFVDRVRPIIEGWQKEYETLMNEQQQALGDLERRFMS